MRFLESPLHKILTFLVILLLAGGGFWLFTKKTQAPISGCTLEAKICPDGSTVGRGGPNCEFAPCSSFPTHPDWKRDTDLSTGLHFEYPEKLPTTYMNAFDWPPHLQVVNETWKCLPSGASGAQAGVTEKHTIQEHTYCVTREDEGAAGSIYSQYAYTFPREGKTVVFSFRVRSVQCGNYPPAEAALCEKERTSFNLDTLIDEMAQTLSQK